MSLMKFRSAIVVFAACFVTLLTMLTSAQESSVTPKAQVTSHRDATVTYLPQLDERDAQVLAVMSKRVDVEFIDTPFVEAIEKLSDLARVSMVVDQERIKFDGISMETPITLKLTHATVQEVLNRMTCNWEIKGGTLVLTSFGDAFVNRFYPIGDLVNPSDELAVRELSASIQSLTNGPWIDDEGEGGCISNSSCTKSLLISAPWQLHTEIVDALNTIRQAKKAGDALDAKRGGK